MLAFCTCATSATSCRQAAGSKACGRRLAAVSAARGARIVAPALGRRSAGSFVCLCVVERRNHVWPRRVLRRPVVPNLKPDMSNVLSLEDQNTRCLTVWYSVHQLEQRRLSHASRTGACITWCTWQLPEANTRARQAATRNANQLLLHPEHCQTSLQRHDLLGTDVSDGRTKAHLDEAGEAQAAAAIRRHVADGGAVHRRNRQVGAPNLPHLRRRKPHVWRLACIQPRGK